MEAHLEMSSASGAAIGAPAETSVFFTGAELGPVASRFREPLHVVFDSAARRAGIVFGDVRPVLERYEHLATLPAMYPEWLGDRAFCEVHGLRFAYVAGEMANGIATTRLVIAMARANMLGFYGAAGLSHARVEAAVTELEQTLGTSAAWGVNLIHSPNEVGLENAVADLLIRRSVLRISASAFMSLTPAVVRCAAAGLWQSPDGRIHRKHHVFAKISRAEVARQFMSPAPEGMLNALVEQGLLTADEARLASFVPVAEDITVEADSGGHTDNQALVVLMPTILQLRDELAAQFGHGRKIRIGAAGGLGTPGAVASAFALGAAYVMTGTVNQSAIEAGLSPAGKRMLAQAEVADVMMAPAADMFELGVNVQVLKRGTMFGVRAAKLYDVYKSNASIDAIPEAERARLERDIFRMSLDDVWRETESFWDRRDAGEADRARRDPKHRMALCFRWYLGKASRWAIDGDEARQADYQIWCGPAMGAFNRWVKGTFLEDPAERSAEQIARNLLEGAASVTRAHQLRTYGVDMPPAAFQFRSRRLQ
jgi:trans-AT polyketide synthase/acyltransferase/oxidoreductase domain-containing protein